MRAFEVVVPSSLPRVARRVLRLLSLYRIVAVVGGFALLLSVSAPLSRNSVVVAFFAFYALAHIFAFRFAEKLWERPRHWLTLAIIFDLMLVLVLASISGSSLFVAGIIPILVAHGWLLRDRWAYFHAALVALSVLLLFSGDSAALTEAAFLGIGAFAAVVLGATLGRMGIEAIELADRRGEDLEKLSALNQRIIDDLDQGVLVVDREGRLLQANPQAEMWLFRGNSNYRLPQPLMEVSQGLGIHWANWKEGNTMLDAGVTLGTDDAQVKVRPRFVSTELRRAGDTVVFLEDLAAAQVRAQQLKLASLGRLTANIAHEIRNPLSAIRQAGQLLAENALSASTGDQRLTDMIEKNVRRIDRIVTNVLSLSKRDKVAPQVLQMATLLEEIVQDWCVQSSLETHSVTLSVAAPMQAMADRGHVEEIIWNLLTNAWRHGKKSQGSVSVAARVGASGRFIAIEVADDGPGVPSEHRESIFEPFFSLSGSSGLGLYISRELAESNGGALELTSYPDGAQFRLILPANQSENEFA